MAKKIARQFALMIVEFVGCLPQANMDMEIEKLVSFNLWKLVWGGGLSRINERTYYCCHILNLLTTNPFSLN